MEAVLTMTQGQNEKLTDDKINTITHLVSATLALMGTVLLIVYSSVAGKPWHIVGFSIYGLSLFLTFLASVLHHGVEASEKVDAILNELDYFAIFLLIAGTFTPVCLVLIRDPYGWSVLGVTWAIAITGITIRAIFRHSSKIITFTLFPTLGWLGLFLAYPVYLKTGVLGVSLVGLGGVFYTIGAIIFGIHKPNPIPGKFGFHEIWHIFVILAALSHFLFMYFFVLPAA